MKLFLTNKKQGDTERPLEGLTGSSSLSIALLGFFVGAALMYNGYQLPCNKFSPNLGVKQKIVF